MASQGAPAPAHSAVCQRNRGMGHLAKRAAASCGVAPDPSWAHRVSSAASNIPVLLAGLSCSNAKCQLLAVCLDELAAKYPHSKFLKIISTDCIPK